MTFTEALFNEIKGKFRDREFTQLDLKYFAIKNGKKRTVEPFLQAMERRELLINKGQVPHPIKNVSYLQNVYQLVQGAKYDHKPSGFYQVELTMRMNRLLVASKRIQDFTLKMGVCDVYKL